MSFFDQPKNAGMALLIVAILELILCIAGIALALTAEGDTNWGSVVMSIGAILCAVVYFKFAQELRGGAITAKIDILSKFIYVAGIVSIIGGIFGLVADIVSGIFSIIIGLIILWCAKKVNDGKQGVIDKILWIILLILMILSVIGGIMMLPLFPLGTIDGICSIIISVFILTLLFDSSVKKEMGM